MAKALMSVLETVGAGILAARCESEPLQIMIPPLGMRIRGFLGRQPAVDEVHERAVAIWPQRDLDRGRARLGHRVLAFPTEREHESAWGVDLHVRAGGSVLTRDLEAKRSARPRIHGSADDHPTAQLVGVDQVRKNGLRLSVDLDVACDAGFD